MNLTEMFLSYHRTLFLLYTTCNCEKHMDNYESFINKGVQRMKNVLK